MHTLDIRNLAQIKKGKVELGDVTLLVGPQASGKSIFLQLFKLLNDSGAIAKTLKKYGYDWKNDPNSFFELYFGEGMNSVWNKRTIIKVDGEQRDIRSLTVAKKNTKERSFLIPAQRVLSLNDGWPRPFRSWKVLDPFVIKSFSEHLNNLMQVGLGSGSEKIIFPQEGRMKKEFRDKINQSIFHNAKVELDDSTFDKRFILNVNENKLPFLMWSAGQKEFMPLLLGLYWLMPSSKSSKRKDIQWVIIEEPEMGLHPSAIQSLILVFLELIYRKYKLIISTHSPVLLEAIWAIRTLIDNHSNSDLLFELFDLPKNPNIRSIFNKALESNFYTYYFDLKNDQVQIKDISTLNPGDADTTISDWGGLSEFSGKTSEIVSKSFGLVNS
jgi:predicted ATPase